MVKKNPYTTYPATAQAGPGRRPYLYSLDLPDSPRLIRLASLPELKIIAPGIISNKLRWTFPRNKKVLVFEPHADDAALFIGAFLTFLLRNKNQVQIANLFSCHLGVAGDQSVKHKKNIRDREDREFARSLGAKIEFLRLEFPYRHMKIIMDRQSGLMNKAKSRFGRPGKKDVARVSAILRQQQPDLILLPHPFDYHQMHADTARLVLAAIAKLPNDIRAKKQCLFYETGYNFTEFGIANNLLCLFGPAMTARKLAYFQLFHSQFSVFIDYIKRIANLPKIKNSAATRLILEELLFSQPSTKEMRWAMKHGLLLPKRCFCERLAAFDLQTL